MRCKPVQHLFSIIDQAKYRWIGIWRCTCRDWLFSSAPKPIGLGLGFQLNWVHMQLGFSPSA
jgi:hypothetical protein